MPERGILRFFRIFTQKYNIFSRNSTDLARYLNIFLRTVCKNRVRKTICNTFANFLKNFFEEMC